MLYAEAPSQNLGHDCVVYVAGSESSGIGLGRGWYQNRRQTAVG